MAHYYKPDGSPCHKQLNKAQSEEQDKDVFRDTDLRDAKKLGLFPSVTGVLPKQDWSRYRTKLLWDVIFREKRKGIIEPDHSYRNRINAAFKTENERAMNLGSDVHKAIEKYLVAGEGAMIPLPPPFDLISNCIAQFLEWYRTNVAIVTVSEQTFCSPEWGYGGCVDLQYIDAGTNHDAITDYKTKSTVEGQKIVQPLEHKRQLVAYALGLKKVSMTLYGDPPMELLCSKSKTDYFSVDDCPILGNLYLSTTEPKRWEYIQVPPDEVPELILDVKYCVREWCRQNDFNR